MYAQRENDDDILTPQEVAEWLKVSKFWIRDHCTRAKPLIPHRKFGKKVRFVRSEVRAFIESQRRDKPTWEQPNA
jgi:excisionase family DNA binding protein